MQEILTPSLLMFMMQNVKPDQISFVLGGMTVSVNDRKAVAILLTLTAGLIRELLLSMDADDDKFLDGDPRRTSTETRRQLGNVRFHCNRWAQKARQEPVFPAAFDGVTIPENL